MAIFSGALVVVTIVSVLYFRSQLNVMEGQLNEMKESGKQTGALVKAAQDSAAAAKKVAEIAEETIRFTAESFKVSERPYIIKQSIALIKVPMVGVKLFVKLFL